MGTKRLRIFAGPNGSGKSVLYNYLLSHQFFHQYFYINADEIAKGLAAGCSFANWPVAVCGSDFFSYAEQSSFSRLIRLDELKANLVVANSVFTWNGGNEGLTYISACIADYMRNALACSSSSFACETVFSHPSKIDFIKKAKENGFKVYLYFVATRDPLINQGRVENRVKSGGHDVPADKIVSRYYRCLDNLYDAVCLCDKTFLFDNSEAKSDFTYNNFAAVLVFTADVSFQGMSRNGSCHPYIISCRSPSRKRLCFSVSALGGLCISWQKNAFSCKKTAFLLIFLCENDSIFSMPAFCWQYFIIFLGGFCESYKIHRRCRSFGVHRNKQCLCREKGQDTESED